jgi:hypothetical protein
MHSLPPALGKSLSPVTVILGLSLFPKEVESRAFLGREENGVEVNGSCCHALSFAVFCDTQ